MPEVEKEIMNYVEREHMSGAPGAELTSDTNLIAEEIIDSLGIFTMITFINEQFGIEIEPEDVTLENFETIAAISRLISSNLPSRTV